MKADWSKTLSPYNPPLGPEPSGTQQPIGVVATGSVTVAWREGTKVKTQRFSLAGSRLRARPAAVTKAGAVKLAEDGAGGSYLAGPSGDGIVVRHVLARSAELE